MKRSTAKKPRNSLHGDYSDIIGSSPQILEVLTQIDLLARHDVSVMIYGETGTGKELVARALHNNSPRAAAPLVVVNCTTLQENLLESELFGHEQGAFTDAKRQRIGKFERADKGTLFLDEIGDLPLSLQPKLLRVLEESEIERIGGKAPIPVDVRIVAATNRNLAHAVHEGEFRTDLYHRLEGFSISLPPLRERKVDIRELVEHFSQKPPELTPFSIHLPPLRERLKVSDELAQAHRPDTEEPIGRFAAQTLQFLQDYAWPGNIRELKKVVTHALIFSDGNIILPEHLPKKLYAPDTNQTVLPSEAQPTVAVPIGLTLKQVEKIYILETLARMGGNQAKTSAVLDMSRPTLRSKLRTFQEEDA